MTSRPRRVVGVAVPVVVLALAAGCGPAERAVTSAPAAPAAPSAPSPAASTAASAGEGTTASPVAASAAPLAGRVVVLDPGHQLGNARHRARIAAPIDAGGFGKPCNTTGTATDAGLAESTFNYRVARLVRRALLDLGAQVVMTRSSDSVRAWGPCVDVRGTIGNPGGPGPDADLRVSIHADGVRRAGARGFHVIEPADRPGWTDDIVVGSRALGSRLRDALVAGGIVRSTYRGRDGIDVRGDLATLNLSDVPAALVELGNMRDRRDAALMSSDAGRRRYATALVAGIRAYLTAGAG